MSEPRHPQRVEAPTDNRRRGWMLSGAGMLMVSTDSLWVRASEAEATDVAFCVACCALVVYVPLRRVFDPRSPLDSLRSHRWPLLAVAVLAAVSQISFITAITQTRVANGVAIVAAAPLLAAGIARVVLGESITRRVALAITMTMGGIGLIVSDSLGSPTLSGDLLALLAVAAFAGNLTIWRRFPEMSRFLGLSISAVIVIVSMSFQASPLSLDSRAYLSIAAMGLCFNPLGRLAHTYATRFAPVSEVALFTPIETVAGTLWAALFLSELPRPSAVVGALIVLAGVFYGTVAGRPRRI